jgi:hypothetical protein
MKNGKRPTRRQKIAIETAGLDPYEWFVVKALPGKLEIKHRFNGSTDTVLG